MAQACREDEATAGAVLHFQLLVEAGLQDGLHDVNEQAAAKILEAHHNVLSGGTTAMMRFRQRWRFGRGPFTYCSSTLHSTRSSFSYCASILGDSALLAAAASGGLKRGGAEGG